MTPGDTTPLVAVAHGSTQARSAHTVAALLDRVRALRPGLDVREAYLDHVAPDPFRAISDLAASGAGEVAVAPVLLTAAYHSRVDLPSVLERVARVYPWLRVRYAAPLGPHPLLLAAVGRRLAETGIVAEPDTALVLAAAGSTDATANAVIADLAAELAERGDWHSVRPAYASAAAPTPAEAVTAARDRGARRVAVATYLLAPGYFADRVAEQARAAGAVGVSAALGDSPEMAELALLRRDEALSGHPSARG